MVDILKRLRENHCRENEGCNALDICACTRMEEAADYIAKLEAELVTLKTAYKSRGELLKLSEADNQKLKDVIKRALEYRLEDVMRRSDIRKLEQAVGKQ